MWLSNDNPCCRGWREVEIEVKCALKLERRVGLVGGGVIVFVFLLEKRELIGNTIGAYYVYIR